MAEQNNEKIITTDTLYTFKLEQDLQNLEKFKLKSDSTDLKGAVRYDAAQALTEEQKAQARANIGVAEGSGSGDVVIAEDEIIVVEGTFDGVEVTIDEPDVETIKNYTGEKLMFLKLVSTIPDGAFNLYMTYSMDGVFSATVGGGAIANVLFDATSGKSVFEIVEAISSSNIKSEYDGTTSSDTLYSTWAIKQMMGMPFGFASLDNNGLIPPDQLPSYVDDVVEGYYNPADYLFYEEAEFKTAITGESGKIYVDKTESNSYRYSGTIFVRINPPEYTLASNEDIYALFNK